MPNYLDCNATTPVDPRVRDAVVAFIDVEFGNAGSRTHEFGLRAKQTVQRAREDIARAARAKPDEVLFSSGATESNNIAILGLAAEGIASGRRHIVTTAIEHKAVLEPILELEKQGFEVTRLPVDRSGWVKPNQVAVAIREDTLLVSIIHVNNETGVIQPIKDIADALSDHESYLHVDAAQGFGKEFNELRTDRIDLISISGHRLYAPKGIGALVARRRGFRRCPLKPLQFGGGQERGLRPGTLPVHLIVGLGLAVRLATQEAAFREARCLAYRKEVLESLGPLEPTLHGDPSRTVPHTLNISFPQLDAEAVIVALKDLIAISNGSACTSQSYEPSHVLTAMGLPREQIDGAIRISWSHTTEPAEWGRVRKRIASLQN